jgi:DNA-binding NtrC family response regulator
MLATLTNEFFTTFTVNKSDSWLREKPSGRCSRKSLPPRNMVLFHMHSRGQFTVMIAENDPILRYTTARILAKRGLSVIESSDGADALREEAAHKGRIDLLITNIRMPNIDGHQLAVEMRIRRPGIPILVLSGEHQVDFPPNAVRHPTLLNPVDSDRLADRVEEILAASSVELK